ncbi:MAG: DUF1553 domain-containing protein, partial [Planctomycetota bacterium]
GSGYLRLSQWDDEPGAGALQGRYDVLDDIVSTTSQAFLGSTIGCARCHDHKADPFDAEHYYQFMAFFHGLTDMSTGGTLVDVSSPEEAAVADEAQREKDAELAALQAERRAIVDALQARTSTAGTVRGPLERLRYRFYRDTWAVLPDFEMFRPEDMGELEAGFVDLARRTRDNAIGFVFEGLLRVPRDGEYEFRARADDGARVSLDRSSVLEIDGLGDEPRSADARRTLQAGAVPMRVEWFNARGAPTLELDWRRVEDARWRYATAAPGGAPAAWTSATFDDSAWSVGEGGFGAPGTPGADVRTEWHEAEIWLRRTFDWDAASGGDPCVVLHHDEDVEVYVNGVLALERDGFASEYATYELSSEGRAALRAGENLLAVHCRQTGGGQYVDVAIVPRAATMDGRTLRDVALGRAPLSAAQPAATEEELTRLVEARGDALLGEGTLERYRALSERIRRTRERPVPRAMAFAARERGGEVPPLAIHVRGNANLLGEPVEPAVPAFLGDFARPVPQALPDGSSSGRRAALARWITAPENPLTARVMVNRVWQHHFGRGIVPSTNDFGELGDRPSNLPLLDWLAHEFVARGWSVKALHRLILSSETWRQSAAGRPEALVVDPENDCLWRMSPRRMSAEEVRDGMLAVAGMLRLERGGPSVFGRMPKAALATSSTPGSVWGESPEAQQNRRTLYIKVKRSLLTPLLVAHDMPDVDSSCPARFTTILPTQALQLLNGDFPHEVAQRFADRLEAELPGPDAQAGRGSGATGDLLAGRVRRGLELALARPVADAEVSDYAAFLTALAADEALTPRRALELFCLTVLNLNEFVFVD